MAAQLSVAEVQQIVDRALQQQREELAAAAATRRTHGGSRLGQTMDVTSYLTKAKIEDLATLPWNQRVGMLIGIVRRLGLEFPTEMCYKHMTSLCLLWEDVDSADSAAKHDFYVSFKAAFLHAREHSAPPTEFRPPRPAPPIDVFLAQHPDQYRFAMDICLDQPAQQPAGLPAGDRSMAQFLAVDRSYQCRRSGATLRTDTPRQLSQRPAADMGSMVGLLTQRI